jgi:hypothetical protein
VTFGGTLPGFRVGLGQVIVRASGDEAWLARAVVLSEARPVAVLFLAPDLGVERAVFALPAPHDELWWLEPVRAPDDVAGLVLGREPALALELSGARFVRTRRRPLRAEGRGDGAPAVPLVVILAEYTDGATGRAVVLVDPASPGGGAFVGAFRGAVLAPGLYDVLG